LNVLAYVFYHWKRPDVSAADYERLLRDFHLALNHAPSTGFSKSYSIALSGAPWANGGSDSYEDWYLVNTSADLDPLNDAAISASRQVPHDQAALAAAGGTAGLYRLRAGATLSVPAYAHWFSKPEGWSYGQLYDRLRPLADHSALWGRQMTLGPAREFCLHTSERVSLPPGIEATVLELRRVFPESA
jgi:hypothetical protein